MRRVGGKHGDGQLEGKIMEVEQAGSGREVVTEKERE